MSSSSGKNNHDIQRQNKATSVVDATLYSKICLEAISTIRRLTNKLHNEDPNGELLKKIIELLDICQLTTNKSSVLYMKCSTYIKQGANEIANNEYSLLKSSVRFKETDDLHVVMHHYDPCMLKMQQVIYEGSTMTQDINSNSEIDLDISELPTEIVHPQQSSPPTLQVYHPYDSNQYSPFIFRHTQTFHLPRPFKIGYYYTPVEACLNLLRFSDGKHRYMLDLPSLKKW